MRNHASASSYSWSGYGHATVAVRRARLGFDTHRRRTVSGKMHAAGPRQATWPWLVTTGISAPIWGTARVIAPLGHSPCDRSADDNLFLRPIPEQPAVSGSGRCAQASGHDEWSAGNAYKQTPSIAFRTHLSFDFMASEPSLWICLSHLPLAISSHRWCCSLP